MTATTGFRSFLSWGTLISGVLAVLLWGLEWNWRAGLLVVLLLYIHEAGHVIAARWRRVPVQRAPFFLPGLGAFVVTSPTPRPWDRVAISLGGPLIGGAAALAAKQAGVTWHMPALAFAGNFMLWVNLLNLAPFGPLDGGQVTSLTGRLGLIAEVVLGGIFLVVGGPVFLGLAVGTLVAQFRARRRVSLLRRGTRLAILGVYLLSVVTLALAAALTPDVAPLSSSRPDWMPDPQTLFLVFSLAFMASAIAMGRVWSPKWRGPSRYLISALLGWPQLLLSEPADIPVMACLAAHLLRMPGLPWLSRLIRWYGARGDEAAGSAVAYGYDCLVRQGRADAAGAWLAEQTPVVQAAGPAVLGTVCAALTFLGHYQAGTAWVAEALDPEQPFPPLPPHAENTLAWCLMQMGRPAAALPLAERAVAAEPDNPSYLDMLGQLQFALGDTAAAEAHLRQSLAAMDRPGTRVALARTLAAQGKYADAVVAAEQALSRRKAFWPAGEPGPDEVKAWVADWRANILPGEGAPAAAVPWYRRVRAFKRWQVLSGLALLAAVLAGVALSLRYGTPWKPEADLPRRVRTEYATILGDDAVSQDRLEAYGMDFERIRPEVAWHLGISCGNRVIEVYGSESAWNQRKLGAVNALYEPATDRIAVADWRSAPRLQTQAMVEMYVVLCVRAFTGDHLPRWFERGLAENESWRVDEGRPDWNTRALRSQWKVVADAQKATPVPNLATDQANDAFVATAVGHLLETRDGSAVDRFIGLAASGEPFDRAFTAAFGVSPEQYQSEYEQAVSQARK